MIGLGRQQRSQSEAARMASDDHAFAVVDASSAGGLHAGQVAFADLRKPLGECLKRAREGFDL